MLKYTFLALNLSLSMMLLAQENNGINWLSLEELEAAHQQEPRKVIVDVYTNWCGWCKRMDKATFQNPEVAAYVNKHYYALKLNAENKDTLYFGNKAYAYVARGRKGYNELAANFTNGKLSYPTVVYLNENLEVIQPLAGFMGPDDFMPVIHYFAEDAYKTQPFEQFKKNFSVN